MESTNNEKESSDDQHHRTYDYNTNDDNNDDDDDRKPPAKVIGFDTSSNNTNNNQANGNSNNTSTMTDDEEYDDDDLSDQNTPTKTPSAAILKNSKKRVAGGSIQRNLTPVTLQSMTTTDNNSIISISLQKEKNRTLQQQQSQQVQNGQSPFQLSDMIRLFSNLDGTIAMWLGAVTLSSGFLIHELIPTNVLVALAALVSALYMLVQRIYILVNQWYDETIIQGNGIGELLLPANIHQMLTQQTFHDFMSAESQTRGNRYLLLYFLPLTREQRNHLIQRVAPQYQEQFFRPGLANWIPYFNDTIMRILIGNTRYEQQQHEEFSYENNVNRIEHERQLVTPGAMLQHQVTLPTSNMIPTTIVRTVPDTPESILPGPTSRRMRSVLLNSSDDSIASDLGLDISEQDLAGGLQDHELATVARTIGLSPTSITTWTQPPPTPQATTISQEVVATNQTTNNTTTASVNPISSNSTPAIVSSHAINNNNNTTSTSPPSTNTGGGGEILIILDALFHSFENTVLRPVTNVTVSYVVPSVASRILRWSNGILSVSAGIGIFGYIGGFYTIPTLSTIISTLSTTVTSLTTRSNYSTLYPSSRSLFTVTAISGGTSLGLAFYLRYYSPNRRSSSSSLDNTKLTKTDEKKQDDK